MVLMEVKVDGTIQPFKFFNIDWRIDPPYQFKVAFPEIFPIQDGGTIEIWRDGSRKFTGRYEHEALVYDENGEHYDLGYRDLSQNGFHRRTGGVTYVETVVGTILTDLIANCNWSVGTIDAPYRVFHKILHEDDSELGGYTHSNTHVELTGDSALVALSALNTSGNSRSAAITPSGLTTWDKVDLIYNKRSQTLTVDILDSGNNVIGGYSNLDPDNAPFDISGIDPGTYPTIKVRIEPHGATETLLTNATGTDTTSMWGANISRAGQYYSASNKRIRRVQFRLKKSGSPTGTAYARIRKVSDDSIVSTSSGLDVSTISSGATGDDYTFNFTDADILNEAVHILVEFTGGDASNYIKMLRTTSPGGNVIDGNVVYYISSYTATGQSDCRMVLTGLVSAEIDAVTISCYADYLNVTLDEDFVCDALDRIHYDLVFGEWQITSGGTFNSSGTLGTDRSGSITLEPGKTCGRISFERDISKQVRDAKVWGAGAGGARISEAGTVTGGTSAYGTLQGVIIDKELATLAECEAKAKNVLTDRQDKLETIKLPIYDWMGIEPGDTVNVKDPDHTGIDGDYRIKRLNWKYDPNLGETFDAELGRRKTQVEDKLRRTNTHDRWLKDQ